MAILIINKRKIEFLATFEELAEDIYEIILNEKLFKLEFEEEFSSQNGSYLICNGPASQAKILLDKLIK